MLCVLLAASAAAVAVGPAGGAALRLRGLGPGPGGLLGPGGPPRLLVGRARTAWQRRSRAARRRAAVVELCTALAAELRAGAMPADAIERAASSVPDTCDEAAAVARLGGDVAAALVAGSLRPGAGGLARLAAVWSVSHDAGAGLADGCQRIADWLRDDEAIRREVAAQLAGARTSARLLAGLPVLGLALGAGIGARPLDVLLGTPYGLGCLAGGVALNALGLWWTARLARSVEDRV